MGFNRENLVKNEVVAKVDERNYTLSVNAGDSFSTQMLDERSAVVGYVSRGQEAVLLNADAKYELVDKVDKKGNVVGQKRKYHMDFSRQVGFDTLAEAEDYLMEMSDCGVFGWFQVAKNLKTGKFIIIIKPNNNNNKKEEEE